MSEKGIARYIDEYVVEEGIQRFMYGRIEMRISLNELEKKLLDFCFGNNCIYHNPENPNVCKLVMDVQNQEPIDYCPLVKFLEWLSREKKNSVIGE